MERCTRRSFCQRTRARRRLAGGNRRAHRGLRPATRQKPASRALGRADGRSMAAGPRSPACRPRPLLGASPASLATQRRSRLGQCQQGVHRADPMAHRGLDRTTNAHPVSGRSADSHPKRRRREPSTPTPVGLFAIAWAIPWNPDDFLGSWVLELTAHSDVLQQFDGGDGTVGIHGRGGASVLDPLGSAASHGCIRLANDSIDWLVRTIGRNRPPGTPVRVS